MSGARRFVALLSSLLASAALTACASTPAAPTGDPLGDCQREVPDTDAWLCEGWKLEITTAAELDVEAETVVARAQKRAELSGMTGDGLVVKEIGDGGTRLASTEVPLLDVYRNNGIRGPQLVTCTYSVVQPVARCREVARLLREYPGRVGYWLRPVHTD